eukprot:GHRR01017827.1.p1 GENE.GHRR01017827.1~~GHRR01017827.1.p1  ORF type:complete len:133 (+),score=23.60 GHRR01017827.1:521-919(+)
MSWLVPIAEPTSTITPMLQTVISHLTELKHLQLRAMSDTRHASSITPADFSQVEGSLKIWWSTKGLDTLSDAASAVIEDDEQYQWDQNKHEARQKAEYMLTLQNGVRHVHSNMIQIYAVNSKLYILDQQLCS